MFLFSFIYTTARKGLVRHSSNQRELQGLDIKSNKSALWDVKLRAVSNGSRLVKPYVAVGCCSKRREILVVGVIWSEPVMPHENQST